jgi:hypothetical protein
LATYNSPVDVSPLTKARSVDINAIDAAVGAAFDALPTNEAFASGSLNYGIDSGSANSYIVTLPLAPAGFTDGLTVQFSPKSANDGPSTLNVNDMGAVSIRLRDSSAVRPGDIAQGVPTVARYSTTTGFFHTDGNVNLATTGVFTAPIGDAGALVKNTADATKLMRFDLNGLSPGSTRTITVPDRDITLGSGMFRNGRTSNTQITLSNNGDLIDITSGTFTQTFDAPAALSDHFNVFVRNSGSGDITIPASDGVTNWIMFPGESRLFQCDGTTLRSLVISPFVRAFASSANFIKPPGYNAFDVELWGAGGGGRGGGTSTGGPGGGGGGYFRFTFQSSALAASTAIAIGAGGAGGSGAAAAVGSPGAAGGTSTFGVTLMTASGGAGGSASTAGAGGAGAGITAAPYRGGTGGPESSTGSAGQDGVNTTYAGAGGGSGASASGGGTPAGNGGVHMGYTAAVGNSTGAGAAGMPFCGGAGGAMVGTNAFPGGAGGIAGGGGGGGRNNGGSLGAGGLGGDGYCIIRGA